MSAADGDPIRRLPTGAHGIPPDEVALNQRERLIAALAEACAEHGYAESSVAEIAHRASVSTATFYKLFAGKRECALDAHAELLRRLLEEVDSACGAVAGREERVRAGVRTVLVLFAADAPTARLLTVEVLALGPAGAARNDAAIKAFGSRLGRERSGESGCSDSEWATIAGIAMLIGKRVIAGEAAALPGLEDELVAMVV
jgi:AcrR family transcriptional regulator